MEDIKNIIDDDENFSGSLIEAERYNILDDLSDDILILTTEDSISFTGTEFFNDKNYLDIFEERYNNICNYYKDDEELITEAREMRDRLYTNIKNTLRDKFKINFQDDLSDVYLVIRALYNHLCVDIEGLFVKYFLKFIKVNKKTLLSNFELSKSLEVFTLKKKIKDKDAINIISNLHPIVNYIINLDDIYSETFIKDTFEEGEYNSFIIANYINKLIFEEDFVQNIFSIIKNNESLYFRIVNKLQLELAKQSNLLPLEIDGELK